MKKYEKIKKTKVGYALRSDALSALRKYIDRGRYGEFISDAILWYLAYAGITPASHQSHGNGTGSDESENNDGGYGETVDVVSER